MAQPLWAEDLKAGIQQDAARVKELYEQTTPPPADQEAELLMVQADGKGVPLKGGQRHLF